MIVYASSRSLDFVEMNHSLCWLGLKGNRLPEQRKGCVCVYMYIYIYILYTHMYMHIHISLSIYIYIYRERERYM